MFYNDIVRAHVFDLLMLCLSMSAVFAFHLLFHLFFLCILASCHIYRDLPMLGSIVIKVFKENYSKKKKERLPSTPVGKKWSTIMTSSIIFFQAKLSSQR